MLSLQQCRDLAGAAAVDLSDKELAVLVEQFYSLAVLTVDLATNGRNRGHLRLVIGNAASLPASPFRDAENLVTDDQRALIEERAAIMEYDANLSRDEAERAAIVLALANGEGER